MAAVSSVRLVPRESIDAVGRGDGANVRLKPLTVDNINRAVEQTRNVVFKSSVIKDSDAGRRIKFNHDVVSLSGGLSPRAREPSKAA
jgi:hypothetical protein